MTIPADDATLKQKLESANLPALLPAIVQLTGDASLLERFPASTPGMMGHVEGEFAEAVQREIREIAFEALKAYRDGGGSLPPLPDEQRLHAMMNWCTGEEVPNDYVPLAIEESALVEDDPRRFQWREEPDAKILEGFHVVVIGGGFGGLCAGLRLEQAGIPYTIVEKNDSLGGTWYENSYPDLRVDVPNHFYCYSFAQNPDWTSYFSRGPEIRGYIEDCATRFGVRDKLRLGTEVIHTVYDEENATWSVQVRTPEGRDEVITANAVISAVGMLNRPQYPDIPGVDRFEGPCFHSSRWDHTVDLAGKRVGVIGTGASAMQFVPPVSEEASQLTVFQRACHWASTNASYRAETSEDFRWLLRHIPYYQSWYRFLIFWTGSDRVFPVFLIDPEWTDPDRSTSLANDMFRQGAIAHITEQLGGDEALIAKCVPDYPPLGKRPLMDNGWYRTLTKEHVDLVTDSIQEITEKGVITADGTLHEFDVLVLATGFHAGNFLYPMKITGKGGAVLEERWEGGENPRAYLGITMPDFPNLFCMYGPNTNPVLGSVIFMLECQATYIMDCLREMLEEGHASIDCKPAVYDAYYEKLDAAMEHMVWRHPRVKSYYNNAQGRVITNTPFKMYDYWDMTRKADLSEYEVR